MTEPGNHSLLRLSEHDNVLVALKSIDAGSAIASDGSSAVVLEPVQLGQKIAASDIPAGNKIIKYGVQIGSAIRDITAGEHVHVHNIKSDYTPTHVLQETSGGIIDA